MLDKHTHTCMHACTHKRGWKHNLQAKVNISHYGKLHSNFTLGITVVISRNFTKNKNSNSRSTRIHFTTIFKECRLLDTHVKTPKLLQICKQVVVKFVVKPISGCVRTACSQLWQTGTSCDHVAIRACWHQLVNNL